MGLKTGIANPAVSPNGTARKSAANNAARPNFRPISNTIYLFNVEIRTTGWFLAGERP